MFSFASFFKALPCCLEIRTVSCCTSGLARLYAFTIIGGVAVGILAVTGVFATEEQNKLCSIEHDEEEVEEDDEINEENIDEEGLIVRSS